MAVSRNGSRPKPEEVERSEKLHDTLNDIRCVSTGTLAHLTGQKSYAALDKIQEAWHQAVLKHGQPFATWQDSWEWFKPKLDGVIAGTFIAGAD